MRRLMMVALLCSTAITAPKPAEAGPVIGALGFLFGGAGFGAVTSIFGFAAGTVGFAVLSAGLRLAGTFVLNAISARLNRVKLPPPAELMRNYAQPKSPMQRIYGKVRKGGPLGFTGFRTNVFRLSGTPSVPVLTARNQATRFNAILIAAHSTKGPVAWYLDDRLTTLTDMGEITTDPMETFGALRAYTGQTGQAVDPVLDAVFDEITTAHNFAELSYVVLEARRAGPENFVAVYPNQREWEVVPVWEGDDQVYDPRTLTRGYSNNAALVIARECEYWGKEVEWAEVAVEAAICDQVVTNREGGTQPRWTINLTLDDTASWEAVRDTLALSCGAWFYQRIDGKIGFKVGRWIAPTITLTDRDFLAIRIGDQEWGPDVPGEFVLSYVEPAQLYREAVTGTYVVEANKPRHEEQCYAIDSHNQAARVAKLVSRALRPGATVSGTLKMIGYEVIGQRFVTVQSAALGRTLTVEVRKLDRNADGITFTFEGRAAESADYDFNAAVEEPVRPVNGAVIADDFVPPVLGFAAVPVTATGGVAQIIVSWTAPEDTSLSQQVRYRRTSPLGDWEFAGNFSVFGGSTGTSLTITGLVDGAEYELQVRNRTGFSGRSSAWSASIFVTAVADSVPPGALASLSLSAAGGGVQVSYFTPNSTNYSAARIYRGTTTVFADAVLVRTEAGAPNAFDSWSDTPLGAGTYYYWAEPINGSGVAGSRSGPQTITI